MHKNIVETAGDAGTLTALIAAIERAGVAPTLEGNGPFTLFAPSDEALGLVTAADDVALSTATTMHGEEVPVSIASSMHVDGARVMNSDIEASNGIIQVIDRVLLPAAK